MRRRRWRRAGASANRRLRWRLPAAALAIIGAPAWPAAPVVEAAAAAPAPAAEQRNDEGGDRLATLYYQLQILQDDVRRLQGVVEEQNHRINRLVQEQRERYVELDGRLVELAQPTAGGISAAPAPAPGTTLGPVAGTAVTTEAGAYNAAFAILNQASGLPRTDRLAAYAQALTALQAVIDQYPAGEFTPNAYYWIGEIHLYTEANELARQALVQVTTLFPDHTKVPDALYKLGVVYHRLGDNERALQYLDRVVAEHPGHTAAELARNYAAELR